MHQLQDREGNLHSTVQRREHIARRCNGRRQSKQQFNAAFVTYFQRKPVHVS